MLSHDHPRFADIDYQPERFVEQPAYDDFPDYQEEVRAELRNEVREILQMIPSLRNEAE
jgi:hypothetical protein